MNEIVKTSTDPKSIFGIITRPLTGIMVYHGWCQRWYLAIENGIELDFAILVHDFLFPFFHGKNMSQEVGHHSYELKLDSDSKFVFDGTSAILDIPAGVGFGFSNVKAYLDDAIQRINGRVVTFELSENGFKFSADPDDDVLGLYYTEDNFCAISDDQRHVCKIGQGKECCIFIVAGATGLQCAKFSGMTGRQLLHRGMVEGTMNAGRIGNCKILGRKKD